MNARAFLAAQVKGIRNMQRQRRTLETKCNKLERRLNALIKSKRIITADRMLDADTDLSEITAAYKALIDAATDALNLVEG